MNKKSLAFILIAVLGAILTWVLFFWSPVTESEKPEHQVLELSATPVGGDFSVEIQNKDLALTDLRGNVVLLYFGYTQCPDICPTNLALMTQALNQLSEDELAKVNGLFVSVDPERDNPTRLEEYVKYFHPNIIGATAEQDKIDEITKLYGAAYRIVEGDSAMGYTVDHSSYTYVIDAKGKLRHALEHATPSANILEVVRELLAED